MIKKIVTIDQALIKLLGSVKKNLQKKEILPIIKSLNRINVKIIFSNFNLPPTSNSAVDGYAISFKDLETNKNLQFKIAGVSKAGHPYNSKFKKNETLEIYTGAVLPKYFDCVVMQENVIKKGNIVTLIKNPQKGLNLRPIGENIKCGEKIIDSGQIITSAHIGQLSASGNKEIEVYKKINTSVFSTGDEIISTNKKLTFGKIYDANRPMIISLLKENNVQVIDNGIVKDNLRKLTEKYVKCLEKSDIVISSGGASEGIEDHTQKALKNIGAKVIFWQLAIKPGKPICVAKFKEKYIFCLPGNPVACFVCAKLIIKPFLQIFSGGNVTEPLSIFLPSDFEHKKKSNRTEFLRGKIINNNGISKISLHGRKGAGVISSITEADGIIELPYESQSIKKDQILKFYPFSSSAL